MKLTTTTQVSVDGVMQANGPSDEDRKEGFERDGWALPLFDDEASAFVDQVYQRADAFLFGRRTYEMFAGTWGAIAEMRAHPIGVALNGSPSTSRRTRSPTRNGRTRPSCPVTSRRPSAS
jgi:dihydrofolate reductase